MKESAESLISHSQVVAAAGQEIKVQYGPVADDFERSVRAISLWGKVLRYKQILVTKNTVMGQWQKNKGGISSLFKTEKAWPVSFISGVQFLWLHVLMLSPRRSFHVGALLLR